MAGPGPLPISSNDRPKAPVPESTITAKASEIALYAACHSSSLSLFACKTAEALLFENPAAELGELAWLATHQPNPSYTESLAKIHVPAADWKPLVLKIVEKARNWL